MIPAAVSHMALGLVLGLRHAFEADHIAAVAAIASREKSPFRSVFIGGFWGLGHLASLLLVGLPVVALSIPIAVLGLGGPGVTRRLAQGVSLGSVIFGLLYGATTLAAAIARHPLS